MTFALVVDSLVTELFPSNPGFHPALTVVDVSAYPSIVVGWAQNTDGTFGPRVPTKEELLEFANNFGEMLATGSVTVLRGSTQVKVDTDAKGVAYLQAALTFSQASPGTTFSWVQSQVFPNPQSTVLLTASDIAAIFFKVGTFTQQVYSTMGQVIDAINAGTITAIAQISSPLSPIPLWPSNAL